jgi:hypothetical protein
MHWVGVTAGVVRAQLLLLGRGAVLPLLKHHRNGWGVADPAPSMVTEVQGPVATPSRSAPEHALWWHGEWWRGGSTSGRWLVAAEGAEVADQAAEEAAAPVAYYGCAAVGGGRG